jgi:hypothetical protein
MKTIVVAPGSIDRGDIPTLCARVHLQLATCCGPVLCDVSAVTEPDAVTIDALARLQLTARSLGCRLWFAHACGELQELLTIVGLCDALPVIERSGLETLGQPEEREQVRGIEEEADPRDPIA